MNITNTKLISKQLLDNVDQYVKLKKYPIIHQAISLIISQKISFQQGRTIRRKLFEIVKNDCFTKENLSNIQDEEFAKLGIDSSKMLTIKNVLNTNFVDNSEFISKIGKIKGIGDWTTKCLQIMFEIDNDIFLFEDLWIRKRISELVEADRVLTAKECEKISIQWKGYRSQVSVLFWRIKPEGIKAIIAKENLIREHFL